MAHDGQHDLMVSRPILENVLGLAREAIEPLETLNQKAIDKLRDLVTIEGKVSSPMIEANQSVAHGVAWLATYTESISQMVKWAENLSQKRSLDKQNIFYCRLGSANTSGKLLVEL